MKDYKWNTSSSITKIKIMKFCNISKPYSIDNTDCEFLTSRQTIGRGLGLIDGIHFK